MSSGRVEWMFLTLHSQAHLHHYTRVEGMEEQLFHESLDSLSNLIDEYQKLEAGMGKPVDDPPRLHVMQLLYLAMMSSLHCMYTHTLSSTVNAWCHQCVCVSVNNTLILLVSSIKTSTLLPKGTHWLKGSVGGPDSQVGVLACMLPHRRNSTNVIPRIA